MEELVEPIARLRGMFETLDRLSVPQERRAALVKAALCHLQFAIDLLVEAQSGEA